jgi:hypothetical protein
MCHHSDSNYGNGALYSPPLLIVVVLGRDPWIDPAMTALEEAGGSADSPQTQTRPDPA